jgi:hypothetical protein
LSTALKLPGIALRFAIGGLILSPSPKTLIGKARRRALSGPVPAFTG